MGTERHSRFLKPTANLSCSMPDAIKIIQLFNNVQMYDCKVYLYTGQPVMNKRGNKYYRQELVEEPLRLIVARSKDLLEDLLSFYQAGIKRKSSHIVEQKRNRGNPLYDFDNRYVSIDLQTSKQCRI